ncbi:hypothetical protein PR048_025823 [Dryococelus australis]|uniref:Uncharacterized protein n=1 Tax=Dryococelus australis TaxID=614101 RepID=A0ABQ9GJM5_9NEOP|nr:hypothetical protein PR048_025823 [Dryococelus australis]
MNKHLRLEWTQDCGVYPTEPVVAKQGIEQRQNKGEEEQKIPEKTRRPAVSFGMIPTCDNPGATPLRTEHDSPSWEASSLTTTPPRSRFFSHAICLEGMGDADRRMYSGIASTPNALDWSAVFPSATRLNVTLRGKHIGRTLNSFVNKHIFPNTMQRISYESHNTSNVFICETSAQFPYWLARHRCGIYGGIDGQQICMKLNAALLRPRIAACLGNYGKQTFVISERSIVFGSARSTSARHSKFRFPHPRPPSKASRGETGPEMVGQPVQLAARLIREIGRTRNTAPPTTRPWRITHNAGTCGTLLPGVAEVLHGLARRRGERLQVLTARGREKFWCVKRGLLCESRAGPRQHLVTYTYNNNRGTTVAEWLACSPPTKANQVQSPAESPDFRNRESSQISSLTIIIEDLDGEGRALKPVRLGGSERANRSAIGPVKMSLKGSSIPIVARWLATAGQTHLQTSSWPDAPTTEDAARSDDAVLYRACASVRSRLLVCGVKCCKVSWCLLMAVHSDLEVNHRRLLATPDDPHIRPDQPAQLNSDGKYHPK